MKARFFTAWAFALISFGTMGAEPETLLNTRPIEWAEADLSGRLMDGAHRFIERKIDEAIVKRSQYWGADSSIETNRIRLRTIVGAMDVRLPARMERYGDDQNPALVA